MKCELERGQRICPYCNERHIRRCQEDVDRWRIRDSIANPPTPHIRQSLPRPGKATSPRQFHESANQHFQIGRQFAEETWYSLSLSTNSLR